MQREKKRKTELRGAIGGGVAVRIIAGPVP